MQILLICSKIIIGMQQAQYESRLRELGLILPNEVVAGIQTGDWKQSGQFYVSRMAVHVAGSDGLQERAYWLKCPHDFFCDLEELTRRKVETAKMLRNGGCNIPYTELFEPATIIQEEVAGRFAKIDGSQTASNDATLVRKELELYASLGLKHMDVKDDNFIITGDGRAFCVDLDFNTL